MPDDKKRYQLDRRAAKIADEIAKGGDPEDLLDATDVSEYLGYSVKTLYQWRCPSHGGKGPPLFPPKEKFLRIKRRVLYAWVDERAIAYAAREKPSGGRRVGRRKGSRVVNGRVIPPDDTKD